jgi:hypothetical protein
LLKGFVGERAASALIMQGHPVTQVAHLLGHSSPNVTLGIYAHWFKQVKSDAVVTFALAIVGDESSSKMVAAPEADRAPGRRKWLERLCPRRESNADYRFRRPV